MLTHNQEQLVYWITERDSILQKKNNLESVPWSDNKVFQEVYFCNVDREDDKVTKWIRENWVYNPKTKNLYTLSMIIARVFNKPDTLLEIGQPTDDFNEWVWIAEDILEAKRERGETIWNGAYIISTNGRKIDKLTHCLELFEKAYDVKIDECVAACKTLAEAHSELMGVYGLASFLAAQVVADLKNTCSHPLQQANDWTEFSAPGPGSLRGLEWFWEEKITKKNYQEKISAAMDIVAYELPMRTLKKICMQNFQNCFCEYDKFMRVTNGTGRSKRKYKGV